MKKRTILVLMALSLVFFSQLNKSAIAGHFPSFLSGSLNVSPTTTIDFISPDQVVIKKQGCNPVVRNYDGKIIIIANSAQRGAAYQNRSKLFEFSVLTGDNETPTYPGVFHVNDKKPKHRSRQFRVPMPFSLFFDRGRALHEGWVPKDPGQIDEWASNGCVHIEQPCISRIFNWANEKTTLVIIQGWRWHPPSRSLHRQR